MKAPNKRAVKKCSKAARRSQAQIQRGSDNSNGRSGSNGIVTLLIQDEQGIEVARVDISREFADRIDEAVEKLGITRDQFLEQAIREHLTNRLRAKAAPASGGEKGGAR